MTNCNTYMRFYYLYKIRAKIRTTVLWLYPRPMCFCGHPDKDHVLDDPLNMQNACRRCICQQYTEMHLGRDLKWQLRPRWRA